MSHGRSQAAVTTTQLPNSKLKRWSRNQSGGAGGRLQVARERPRVNVILAGPGDKEGHTRLGEGAVPLAAWNVTRVNWIL